MTLNFFRKYMKAFIWFIVITFVISIFLIGAAGLFDNMTARSGASRGANGNAQAMAGEFQSEEPVAVVKMHNTTDTITEGHFQRYLAERGYRERLAEVPAMFRSMLENQALDELVAQRLMVLEASHRRIDVSTSVDQQVAQIRQQTGSEDSFRQFLASNGFTSEEEFRNYIRPQLLMTAMGSQLFEPREVPDDEIRVYYQANKDQFMGEDGKPMPLEMVRDRIRERLRSRVDEASMRAYYERHKPRWQKPVKADMSFMLVSETSPQGRRALQDSITDAEIEQYYNAASSRFLTPKRAEVADLYLDRERLEQEFTLSDEEVRAYYDQNPEEFQQAEEAHARHILIRTGSELSSAEAMAKALRIRQQILSAEVSFEEAAREHSEDPGSGRNGGDLGFFPRGRMVPPFEEYAFSAPLGELSEPIESDFGFHLIEVLERRDAGQKDFEEVKDEARSLAQALKVSKEAYAILDEAVKAIENQEKSFEALVKEYSDASTEDGGVVGLLYLGEGNPEESLAQLSSGGDEMDPPVLQAVKDLKAGTVSDPVETANGFHLLKVNRTLAPERKPLEEVSDVIRDELLKSRLQERYAQNVESVKQALKSTASFEEVASQYTDASVPGTRVFEAMVLDPQAKQPQDLVEFGLSSGLEPMQADRLRYLEAGDVSRSITVENGVVWALARKVYPPEYEAFEVVQDEIREAMTLTVTEQEILEYYRSNSSEFEQAGSYVIQQVVYQNEAVAKSQLKSMLSGGITIDEAGKSSLNLDRASFRQNEGRLELSDVSFFSEQGQAKIKSLEPESILSEPIRSNFGWHVVKLVEKKEERQLGLMEVREQILTELRSSKRNQVLMRYLDELRNKAQEVRILRGGA